MGNVYSVRYNIKAVDAAGVPDIDFAYFKGEHSVNCWSSNVDLNMCKINFFVAGRPYIIVNGKSYAVTPGDIMIYHPHDIHYGNIPCEQYIEYYQLQFEPEALTCLEGGEELIRLFFDHSSNIVQIHPTANSSQNIKKSLDALLSNLKSEEKFQSIKTITGLLEILMQINGCKEFNIESTDHGFYPEVLMNAIRFIDSNYSQNISTADISEAVFVSRSYLNKLFGKYLDLSIHKYLLFLRISKACHFLSEGMSVTDTAMRVGFESSTSFAGAFKSVSKVSPSEFKKQYRKK